MADRRGPKKLGLSFFSSFQVCRSKDPTSMAKAPSPSAAFMLSPVNCNSFDILFPSFPDAPPSTPSEISPVEFSSHAYAEPGNEGETSNSIVASDCNETTLHVTPRNAKHIVENITGMLEGSDILPGEIDEGGDGILSSLPSFTPCCNYHFDHPSMIIATENELPRTGNKPVKQTSSRTQRFEHSRSKDCGGGEHHAKKSIPSRLVPCMKHAKVNESFVVVKRSMDPYEDFKKSMLEMILEKQIFEPKELEHLLMSFISLNSRIHHKVIIEAFTEILKCVVYK